MDKRTIACLGMGAMGSRMAMRLVEAGERVVVYNRSKERAEELIESGALWAETPKEAASQADVVICMVTDDRAAEEVWLDEERGALWGMKTGSIAIESSTVTPQWCERLSSKAQGAEVMYLDAPVAGSRPQAEEGQLIYFVGGDENVLASVSSLLKVMGKVIVHVGTRPGDGARLKLAVNALFGVQVALGAELLSMLTSQGIAEEKAVELLGGLPVTSPALKGAINAMHSRNFAPLFPVELVEKDLRYATEVVRDVECVPLIAKARQVFLEAKERGFGADNITGVAKLYL